MNHCLRGLDQYPLERWDGYSTINLNGYTCIPESFSNSNNFKIRPPTTYQLSYVVLRLNQKGQPRLANWNEAQGLICSQEGVALTVDLICSLFWPRPVVGQIGGHGYILSQKYIFFVGVKVCNRNQWQICEFASRSPKLQSVASQNGSWLGS